MTNAFIHSKSSARNFGDKPEDCFQDWMKNGLKGIPSSFKKLSEKEHINVNLD